MIPNLRSKAASVGGLFHRLHCQLLLRSPPVGERSSHRPTTMDRTPIEWPLSLIGHWPLLRCGMGKGASTSGMVLSVFNPKCPKLNFAVS